MTDNRTTELLREGLTEHSIEWRSGLKGVTFVGDWCFVEYDNGKFAATCEPVLTPEQVIAAALGSGTCEMEYGGDVTEDTKRVLGVYFCSECGSPIYNDCMPYFCIYCGKAVKR